MAVNRCATPDAVASAGRNELGDEETRCGEDQVTAHRWFHLIPRHGRDTLRDCQQRPGVQSDYTAESGRGTDRVRAEGVWF